MSDLSQFLPQSALRLPQMQGYSERADAEDKALDRWWRRTSGLWMTQGTGLRAWMLRAILPEVHRHAAEMAQADDATLKARAAELRPRLRAALSEGVPRAADIGPAFALVREVAGRQLGMRHFDVQVIGAWAMMRGMVAEMRTGEGKTLCATLAAATHALGGTPVHVITVNDYLAARDAEIMRPLYAFLGLSVGVVQAGQSETERQAIYASDIVHASNKEIAFDYLRDRMVLRRNPGNLRRKLDWISGQERGVLRMRGLHFAIVDEVDSVLIDEARTPLVISGQPVEGLGRDTAMLRSAMDAARALEQGRDYTVKSNERRVELTQHGKDRLEDMVGDDAGASGLAVRVIREHAVVQALTALHVFHRDEDYILRDGKVQIVDENTGRVMADRSWSEGLHQMVELKEQVALTEPRETLSRITYQRFFRRYGLLAGMTGTARDAAWELWSVYGLRVACIPTNRPDIRRFARDRILRSEDAKWAAIAARVAELHAQHLPVLLGTRSVAASEKASARLTALGIAHQVLSAAQDADEAAIISHAGEEGAVTVATNIAGRGTDVKLGAGIAGRGGLHIILTERHDSRRVDRQLEGRCGRQGDPGQVEAFLSLDDDLLRGKGAQGWRRAAAVALALGPGGAGVFIRLRQRQIERLHARMRHDLLEVDRNLGNLLAFSGQME